MQAFKLEEFDIFSDATAANLGDQTFGEFYKTEVDPKADPISTPQPGYEGGYKAGWEDAEKKLQDLKQSIRYELSQNLQDIAFTFIDAKVLALRAIEPVIKAIIDHLLPKTLHLTLGARLVETIQDMAKRCADTDLRLNVSTQDLSEISELMKSDGATLIKIVEEPSLKSGQVYIGLGEIEEMIDFSEVFTEMKQNLAAVWPEAWKKSA
jgi:flagellar biosynthesis/type III secretory pathway protein FliH